MHLWDVDEQPEIANIGDDGLVGEKLAAGEARVEHLLEDGADIRLAVGLAQGPAGRGRPGLVEHQAVGVLGLDAAEHHGLALLLRVGGTVA